MNDIPINDVTREAGYFAKRSGIYAVGKGVSHPLAETLATNPYLTGVGKSLGFGAGEGIIGMLAIGLTAAISAGLTLMDYNHKRDNLKDLYKEELSSLTGKAKDKITTADLDQLAKGNATIDEEIRRSKKQRNIGVFISFAASMAALSIVAVAAPAFGLAAASFTTLAGIGTIAFNGIAGLIAYQAVKEPLHKVADFLFHIDDRTVNDHIVAIVRDREMGKIISREQIMSAFVAAHPELDQMIVNSYGKHFDDLALADKQRAVQQINQMIPLDAIAIDINSGRINATEIAFMAQGQSSGVRHSGTEITEEQKHGLKKFFSNVGQKINHSKIGHGIERVAASALAPDQMITPVTEVNESPVKPFVERLGLSRKDRGMSHVERVEQSRSGEQVAQIQ